jgi:hypothetical protein
MKHVRIYKRGGDRGFHQYGKSIRDDYGSKVTVYESSAANSPHVWVKIADERDRAIAHLTKREAEELIRRLQTWIDEIPSRWQRRMGR